jgi:hypothetical protein
VLIHYRTAILYVLGARVRGRHPPGIEDQPLQQASQIGTPVVKDSDARR